MDSKKFSSHPNNNNSETQVQHVEQIPNRSTSNRLVSSHLIPPVTTNRTHTDTSGEELNKNISSDYQEIQIRTLTKWINVQLSQVDESINSIDKDLKDGKKLLKLLSVVSKNPSLKPERGSMRIHQLSNVAQALKFLQDQWGADSLPAIAGEAIVNGDVKSTLAITFFIMLKYQIHPILLNNPDIKKEDNLKVPPLSPLPSVSASRSNNKPMVEAKLALLYWVRNQLQDYIQNHIITTIQDFSRSWRSGLAFCLLIHRHDPDLIPTLFTEHIEHASEKETWHTLLSLAFDIAEQYLNIPKYLEPEDLIQVEYPHEPSVMMYVSEMYKVMSFKDSKIEKRLRDISFIVSDNMTPPDDNDEEEEEEEELLPNTPQPELLINDNDDVYQQLDTLSLLLTSSLNEEKEIEQQLKDNKKSRLLLDQAQHIINKLDPNSSEKQVLFNRYNQLKSEWEILSKKLQQQYKIISIHPLDGNLELIETYSKTISNLSIQDEKVLNDFELFKRGITFNQITIAINEELNIIQKIMSNNTNQDELIQNLEQRIHIVNTSIQGIREEFKNDLLIYDTNNIYFDRFINLLDEIEDKYNIVRDWVDQVRSWFIEAERIRNWIDKQIKIIEERNNLDNFNPIDQDLNISDTIVIQLHQQHEKLKQEIDHFDSDDMNRLRNHVKSLTTNENNIDDISPADTSTIEITLTTLNKLNQLTNLLSKRSQFIELLILRVKWENLFSNAVQWIANTDYELDLFLKTKARWSEEINYEENNNDNGIESVIKNLVSLERKISDFDHGDYSNVLDAYQEMESLLNDNLPNYLELRQLGFEKAFEDLMKRSGFSRKVVEQLLSMINIIDKFKELRDKGENLRYHLLQEQDDNNDDDIYTEKVQLFKEESAKLITNSETCIPYPNVPEMSTAIGANDSHDNQITNENIRSTISTYIMSLALIADGLDQLLMSRYQIISLQQRTQEAYDSMKRIQSWMEERIKLLLKSRLDNIIYSNEQQSIIDEENFHRLEKERDNIASRLEQMENDELSKLFETVRILEYDVDALNAVSIDRNQLVNGIESLENIFQQLKDLLFNTSLELNVLKKRMDWEIQWSKSNNHLNTIGRKLSDFNIKKARYDPSKENIDKPSYLNDHENMQSLQFIQDRVNELGDKHLTCLEEFYQEMIESYSQLNNNDGILPEFISIKQFNLKSEYDDLKLLSTYTLDLMTQRSTIIEFLLRCQDAHHEGEKIKEVVLKKTRRIMIKEENENSLIDHIDLFKQQVKSIWQDCGKNMLYPVYNGNWLRSSDNAGLYRSHVRVQIKSLIDKKMDELSTLEKSIDQLLKVYLDADNMKSLVNQYEKEAIELGQWINEQIELLKNQHIDVSTEGFLDYGLNISELKKSRLDLYLNVESFESTKVKILHDQIARLVEDSVEKKKNQSVDVSFAARNLGKLMDDLSLLKRGLSDQAITLEAASMRFEWENSLQLGITKLEEMNQDLRNFTIKKNQWISQDDLTEEHVNILQQDLNRLISKKNKFEKSILPGIQLNYDNFVEYFPKLSRPIATPDHLEARMESLGRTCSRFQENVSTRSKELDLIKKRIKWEDTVKQALNFFYEQEIKIENFIEERARWNTKLIQDLNLLNIDNNDESKLCNELSSLFNEFKLYQDNFILPMIQKKFDNLIIENNNNNDGGGNILSNSFMKKMQDIKLAQDRTSYYLDFSNQVVNQRCLVSSFILRTAQLEQSAELIREEFILTKANGTNHIVGLLEDHTNRLEKFKSGIDDVRQNLSTSIPYPIRSIENISTQAKLKDETTNSIIKETIEMRNTRLDEIFSSLEQLLESKERVSRRRLSLHSYKNQSKITESWIDSRQEILNRSNSIIVKKELIDLEKLKEAVSQADSVEQAMKSNQNVFTLLNNTFDKCITAFEDKSLDQEGQDDLIKEIEEIVEPTQKRISQAWNNLLIEATETTKNTTALLIENKIQNWLNCLNTLSNHLVSNNDDNQLSIWINELDKLENQEYQNLMIDVEANKNLLNQEQLNQIESLFKTGSNTIIIIRSKITNLQNEIHLCQLIEKYLLDISKLQDLIQVQIDQLNKTNESHLQIDFNSTSNDKRNSQHQNLVIEFKQASDKITDLKEIQSDVFTQYNTILTIDQSFNDTTKEVVSSKWDTLLSLESMVSALVSRSSKWVKHFNSLIIIRQDLESIQLELTKQQVEYKQLDEKLNEIDSLLKGELFNLLDELTQDTINLKPFEIQRKECLDLKNKLKLDLDYQITEKEKSNLIQFIQSTIQKLCKECQDQINSSNQHISTIIFDNQQDIQTTINACSNIINTNNSIYSNIQNEIDSLRLNQCNQLLTKLNCTEQQVNEFLNPISINLNQLDQFTQSEKECLLLANLISQYLISEKSLLDTIENHSSKISNTIEEDILYYLESQLESLDENKKDLVTIGQNMITFEFKHLLQSEIRISNISCIIQKSQELINKNYDEFIIKLQNSRNNMEEIKKRQQIIIKLNDLISFISDMNDRVQLTTSNSNESEFEELCQDFYQTLKKKTKTKDSLIQSFKSSQNDEQIQQLEQRLSHDIEALNILISIKKKQASDEGDLTEFLHIMNEFEEQIMIVLSAIENASPHHSGMINNKFIKSDLQALLRSLVSTFKQNQISINKTLDRAHLESKKQFLGDNERVATLIQKATKKWSQVQTAAAARERELQTCIGKLDHEFFTKLAMAKTTPKKSRPPVKKQTRYLNTVRRTVDETNKKSSKTPISASSSASRLSRPSYVPDPKNALDIELSHIVNASPYRITVKIVPDQVGKYWFGDENPRLVYCRILPSQLVMVRVGGGWVELSKFLREHGITEGISSRPNSSNDNVTNHQEAPPFQEGYLQTFRSSSPTGRITIRGGGGNSSSLASTRSSSKSSGSRSRSPLPGFVDGDKYISVDEAGNHVVVKMKKANNDAKMPIIKKKQ